MCGQGVCCKRMRQDRARLIQERARKGETLCDLGVPILILNYID